MAATPCRNSAASSPVRKSTASRILSLKNCWATNLGWNVVERGSGVRVWFFGSSYVRGKSTLTASQRLFRAAGYFSLCLTFLVAQPIVAQSEDQAGAPRIEIPPAIKRILVGHRLPPDSYSFLVQEVNSLEALLAVNPTLPLNPASTIKTLTTLAALEVLGPAYTWETS